MSIIKAIGNTPLVELTNLNKNRSVKIFGKLEGSNPGGSIKDRPALYMITKGEESGKLNRDKIILEPTSGNTGIALAMIGRAKGYRVRLVMPECVSIERRHILESYGAELIITPGNEGTDGAIRKAHQIISKHPEQYYMPNQFDNPSNVLAHYETTGPEIFSQTMGKIDVLVAGMGTCGTLVGTGSYLREQNPEVRIVAVEPTLGHSIQGLKNMEEAIVPGIYCPDIIDTKITINDDEAFETSRNLARNEGIFVGMSSGAALAGAIRYAKRMTTGAVVAVFPDRGDRYLSTSLFRSICAKCPP